MIKQVAALHHKVFDRVECWFGDWFLGLCARFAYAAVLFVYFFNSAATKVGEGFFGFLFVSDNAYFQILPPVVERYGYDPAQVPFLPYGLIVHAGTYAELILPLLIVVGLFTRVAALGMIVFVAVQSFVDIRYHGVDAETVGAYFDAVPDALILDQRLLWGFLLVYLVVRGAGAVSVDRLIGGAKGGG